MKLFKRFYPVILILFIWFIFANPYFLKGKVPYPSTYQVNNFSPWSSYDEFAGPVKNGAMPDIITQIFPWKNFAIESLKNFEIPLWNPYSFSGSPFLANYQSAVLSPLNIIFFLPLKFIDAWSLIILLQPLLAGLFTYAFVRSLKIGKAGSLLASISFMFCGFITTWMAYGVLGYAIIFLPLALFAIEKYLETDRVRFLILFSLTIPLSFFSGHFQTSIYFFLFVIFYLVYVLIKTRNFKKTFKLLIYLLIGVLMSTPQLLPSYEFYLNSVRSSLFGKVEVIPWGYLPTLIAPDFLGNPVTRNDWFGHYAEWNGFVGIFPLLLAFYSVSKERLKTVLFFLVMIFGSLLLAYNTPLVDFLVLLKIPVLSTSAASRVIVLFSFSVAVLSAFGLENLLKDIASREKKKIIIWLVFCALIFALLWGIVFFHLFLNPVQTSIAKSNLILPSLIFVLGSLSILFSSLSRKTLILALLIIGLTSFEMLRFSSKWQPWDPKNLVFPSTSVSKFFPKISSQFRTFGTFGAEDGVYYKLPLVEGYEPLYIKRYGEFMESLSDGKIKEPTRYVVSLAKDGKNTPKAINLLGIKYFVHKVSDGRAIWAFPIWNYKPEQFRIIYQDSQFEVFENKNVFPRAYLVNNIKLETDSQKILDNMFRENVDLRNEVVIEEAINMKPGFSTGSASIISYKPNSVSLKTNSDGDSLLLLTDVFYPGWKATVDGKEVKIYRSDYTFRSVVVPGGQHEVKFLYKPLSFEIGKYLALISFILLIPLSFLLKKK